MALKLDIKKGALSESLGIDPGREIPDELLKAILAVEIPDGNDSVTIQNPTSTGRSNIVVDGLMKKRANFAYTARNRWRHGGE